jgi:hypothetical protein
VTIGRWYFASARGASVFLAAYPSPVKQSESESLPSLNSITPSRGRTQKQKQAQRCATGKCCAQQGGR